MILTLSGAPLSTNTLYRRHGHFIYMTTEGKQRKEQYQWEVKSQWKKGPIATPLSIGITLYFDNHRRRDIDNFFKIALDAGTGILWLDDSQIAKMIVEKKHDPDNPRIEIEIL